MKDDKKNKASKKGKQAKIIQLSDKQSKHPLDQVLKDLEKIDKDLAAHWDETEEEDIDDEQDKSWLDFSFSKKLDNIYPLKPYRILNFLKSM